MKNKTIKFKGSVINSPIYQCAIIKIPRNIIGNQKEAEDAYKTFKPLFNFLPLVFMVDDNNSDCPLFGEIEAVRFIEQYPYDLIKWGEFEKSI